MLSTWWGGADLHTQGRVVWISGGEKLWTWQVWNDPGVVKMVEQME